MKKLSKKWKIFLTAVVILIGSFYGYYKINNRNAFEEMYNSYYNFVLTTALYNMPQIEPIGRDNYGLDIVTLKYEENNNEKEREIYLINSDNKIISIRYSVLISDGVHLAIYYSYDINSRKLTDYVNFYGKNVPDTKDEKQ